MIHRLITAVALADKNHLGPPGRGLSNFNTSSWHATMGWPLALETTLATQPPKDGAHLRHS